MQKKSHHQVKNTISKKDCQCLFCFPKCHSERWRYFTKWCINKLCNGCMISWDGSLLRHCTYVQKSSPNEFRSSNIYITNVVSDFD